MKTKVDECYHSPPFSFDGARWYLEIYPHGETEYGSVGYVGLYLARESDGPSIQLNFSLGLKTSNNETACEQYCTNLFGEEFDIYGCFEFLKRSILVERFSELVPSGHLTCVCRIKHPESPHAESKFYHGSIIVIYHHLSSIIETFECECTYESLGRPLTIEKNYNQEKYSFYIIL